jgi:phosphoribosylformylglycinamidine synthase
LRDVWEMTSDLIEASQISAKCLKEQQEWRRLAATPTAYRANFTWSGVSGTPSTVPQTVGSLPRVAILREEGSNGDREMAAAFSMARFETYDLTMSDILECAKECSDPHSFLLKFNGIAFVGGFSYGDVLGSAKGWAAAIKFNDTVYGMFQAFRRHPAKFSFGVCNGCQLMSLLGFIGGKLWSRVPCNVETVNLEADSATGHKPRVFLDDNESGRFYSGFNTVRIEKSDAVMLKGMESAVLGVWCSHGEGRNRTGRDVSTRDIAEGPVL